MRNFLKESFVAANVLMKFEYGSVSFCIPEGATLADISENMDKVGKWHGGKIVSIDVRFKAPDKSGFGCDPDRPFVLGVTTGPRTGLSHGTVRSLGLASSSLIELRGSRSCAQ